MIDVLEKALIDLFNNPIIIALAVIIALWVSYDVLVFCVKMEVLRTLNDEYKLEKK